MTATATATTMEDLWRQAWQSLREGKQRGRSAFHQGVLATQSVQGPEARYVVLRQANEEGASVSFNTDIRSAKAQQIRQTPRVSWCFYGDGLQIRINGIATLHYDDDISRQFWDQSSIASRRCYLGEYAPGSLVSLPELETAATLGNIPMTAQDEKIALDNFMSVQVKIENMDVLLLQSGGHLRANFCIVENSRHSQWLTP